MRLHHTHLADIAERDDEFAVSLRWRRKDLVADTKSAQTLYFYVPDGDLVRG